jgi:hypothetical protein
MRTFRRFDFEVSSVDITETGYAGVVKEIEALKDMA